MIQAIENHIEKMLQIYTHGQYFDLMKAAKERYVELTGKLDEDKEEFESRMNCFNEWYLFQWKNAEGGKLIEDYLRRETVDAEISKAFLNLNHSLFEFVKTSFKGQIVLQDILHNEKIVLHKDHVTIGLVEDDIFIGRTLKYQNEHMLLRGICTLPESVKKSLRKQSRKVRGMNSFEEELRFLLSLEQLKTRSMHYQHIEPSKIFVFS
jgi:hypothetical protein